MSLPPIESPLPGVLIVQLRSFADARGRFVETYRKAWFPGLPEMIQSNRSDSSAGVLRGLHFHRRQADYWVAAQGRIQVALADLRIGSPTRGEVVTLELGEADVGVYVPPGVAHGFLALSDAALTYQVDQYYDGSDELGVAWDDPELAIPWALDGGAPILSERDTRNPTVAQLDSEALVRYSR